MSGENIKVGNYILGKTLGEGSFGKVKLGKHELTGKQVAVKIFNLQNIQHLKVTAKMKSEIENLKTLRHPNIIQLFQIITSLTELYMITEYASGGELYNYIVTRGKLQEKEARQFFQQIISGVEYCHQKMIVHRDLKPENLLLDGHNQTHLRVKIADFGLSALMKDGDFLRTSCGSPNYAAPEVIEGKQYAGPEVDIWSCGVILYAMLCGKLPFEDSYAPNLFRKIKAGAFTIPSFVERSVVPLIRQILTVDPVKRATIGDIKKHPWFKTDLPAYLFPEIQNKGNRGKAGPKKIIWVLGIQSHDKPLDIMTSVYAGMKELDWEWKTVNTFQILVRQKPLPDGITTGMRLQLYQVDHKTYVLDFTSVNVEQPSNTGAGSGVEVDQNSGASGKVVMDFLEMSEALIKQLGV